MANITVQTSLPDSSNKSDFYSLIQSSTVTQIVNADISATAAIVATKLAAIATAGKVDGAAITNLANVPGGAGVIPAANLPNSIADSHLATIATAGKVSGAALTSLSSIPSGAGVIPTVNLPSLGAISFVSNTAMAAVASSGDIAITAGNVYLVEFNIPTLGSDDFIVLRFNNDTGSNYQYIVRGFNFSTTAINANSVSTTSIALGGQLTTSGGSATPANGYFYIFQQAANATKTIAVSGRVNGTDHTANVTSYYDVNGLWTGNAVVTSFRFLCSGGSNLTGNIYLYKISLS